MKRYLILIFALCLLGGFASAASAAKTFKQTGVNPFYRPPLTSEEDLRALVKKEKTLLEKGFSKAGYPLLYKAFTQQFPSVKIDAIKIRPGVTFKWMMFRKKGTGPVIVSKNIAWQGSGPLDAYRFYIDRKGKRYEIVVLNGCGNFALSDVAKTPAKRPAASSKEGVGAPLSKTPAGVAASMAPSRPITAGSAMQSGATEQATATSGPAASQPDAASLDTQASPSQAVSASEKAAAPLAAVPGTAASASVESSSAAPGGGARETAAGGALPPAAETREKATGGPAVTTPEAPRGAVSGGALSTAKFPGGPVVDAGFSYQFDPASYLFARVGYELPLVDKLNLMLFLGGSFRIHGDDGGSAFIADALLDYRWWNRLSFGLGAGYWSGNDGQLDLIANLGFLIYGKPDAFNSTLFIEGRSAADELDCLRDQARLGLGIRFRF